MGKAHFFARLSKRVELLRWNEPLHGKMMLGRLKVLPKSEQLHIVRPKITHHLDNLIEGLAEAQHQSRFCGHRATGGGEVLQ